jgi:precorrin-3B methylase
MLLLFFSIGSVAQNKETKEADKLFDSYEYVSAAKAYLSLVENGNNSAYVYEHLADSYKIETQLMPKNGMLRHLNHLRMQILIISMYKCLNTMKYDEADKQMKLFVTLFPNDKRSLVFKNNPNYLTILKNKSHF